jgi:hypothetical protein
MQTPGQWYLDRTGGKLVYWPRSGENIRSLEVIAPTTQHVISIIGDKESPVTDITIDGLAISATTTPLIAGGFAASAFGGAVETRFASNCRLADLRIANVGGHAIDIRQSEDMRIQDCSVKMTGAGGIYCRDSKKVEITDNIVHDVGIAYPSAMGMNLSGNNLRVANNTVYNVPYSGIGSSASDTIIEKNEFHDVMTVLNDGAAVYITFCKNVTVRGNVMRGSSGNVASAYYMDEQTENSVVERNLAVNSRWPSHNHMAKNNTIRNNVFIDEGSSRLTFPKSSEFTFEGNVVYALEDIEIEHPEAITNWSKNLFFSARGSYKGVPDGEKKEDPRFVDVRAGDYRYQQESPALNLGLKPLDATKAGRRGKRGE